MPDVESWEQFIAKCSERDILFKSLSTPGALLQSPFPDTTPSSVDTSRSFDSPLVSRVLDVQRSPSRSPNKIQVDTSPLAKRRRVDDLSVRIRSPPGLHSRRSFSIEPAPCAFDSVASVSIDDVAAMLFCDEQLTSPFLAVPDKSIAEEFLTLESVTLPSALIDDAHSPDEAISHDD